MSALQLSLTEKIRKVTAILPPASLSAIIITPYPKEFPEVEELYAIIQGGRTIRKFILQFQPPNFHLAQPQSQQDFLASETKKIKSPTSIEVTRAIWAG